MRNLINLACFQAVWWSSILGAAAGCPWTGVLVAALVLPSWWLYSARPRQEASVAAGAAVLGWCLDASLVGLGSLAFPAAAQLGSPVPVWMVALWAGFAATLSTSLAWLRNKPAAAALFGAVGGPLAYEAGRRLGAVELGPNGLAAVAAEWAIATPVLGWLARRLEAEL